MRQLLVAMLVAASVSTVGVDLLEACGAKFLVASRSARFQRAQKAAVPAEILIFQHTDEKGVKEFTRALQDTLANVGHRVAVVDDLDSLRGAAQVGQVDLVMLDLEQARGLRADLETWVPDAAILPMVAFATRSERSIAKREFGRVLSLPAGITRVLSTVDDSYPSD